MLQVSSHRGLVKNKLRVHSFDKPHSSDFLCGIKHENIDITITDNIDLNCFFMSIFTDVPSNTKEKMFLKNRGMTEQIFFHSSEFLIHHYNSQITPRFITKEKLEDIIELSLSSRKKVDSSFAQISKILPSDDTKFITKTELKLEAKESQLNICGVMGLCQD